MLFRSNASIDAPSVTITAAGGVISRGDLSLSATGTDAGQGLFAAGLLLAGGTVVSSNPDALTATSSTASASSSGTSVQGSTLQASDLKLDPSSRAVLSLEVRRDGVDALVLGGSTSGSGASQVDTVVAGAWMAAPSIRISSPQSPRILHDLIARDSLAITATSASAGQATLRLSPMAQLLLGEADGTSASSSLTLQGASFSLPGDAAGLAIEALTTAPQEFLNGQLSETLVLKLAVSRQGETRAFSASVAAQQAASLTALVDTINGAISSAATAAGLQATNGQVPVLDLRGASVRLTLRPPTTGDRLDPSLALTLDTRSSTGLEQLGSFVESEALTAVTPATVQSRARATSLAIGTANQGFSTLQWDGGVRSSAADADASVTWTLRPATAEATQQLNAPIDVPVVRLTPDAAGGTVSGLAANVNLMGRTQTLEISQSGDLVLTSLADVSSAPNLQNLSYRSTAGSLTLTGSDDASSIPTYSTSADLTLEGATALTIGRDSGRLVLKVPALKLSTAGGIRIGSGAELTATGASRGGISIEGSSVDIAGALSTSAAVPTTVRTTAGPLSLAAGARLAGLLGSQTYEAIGADADLIQSAPLGSTGFSADISLGAGRRLSSAAAISTSGALTLAAVGDISTAEEIYTTADNVLVDKLGYRVDSDGSFVTAAGAPLGGSESPVYGGTPVLPWSGGAIRAGRFNATASSGNILLAGSVYPAGTADVTSVLATAEGFSDSGDLFTIVGHGLATGTAVRFYGVQEGALLPLVDGGLYYVIRRSGDTFQLAGSSGDATAGRAIAITVAPELTTGTLASFSPQVDLGTSTVTLSGRGLDIRGSIQTQDRKSTRLNSSHSSVSRMPSSA